MISIQVCSYKRNRLLVSSDVDNTLTAREETDLWLSNQPARKLDFVARLRLVDVNGYDREFVVVESQYVSPMEPESCETSPFGTSRGDKRRESTVA